MKIELVRLRLQNFKGIRSLDIKFRKITNILGENATGKTSIFDAFLWLFFGKDSTDRKDFNIKTLGADNEPFHKLDHEVAVEILVDSKEISIRRVYKENWVTQKGSTEPKMEGHKQSFFWNDVPLKLEEFQAKVAAILPETIFKLITNTGYFNNLKWQDRRSTLMDIAGEITNQDVLDSLPDITASRKHLWDAIFKNLNADKTIEEYQRELAVKKKKVKDELQLLPARIDEANRALPAEQDYAAIEADINVHQDDLQLVEGQLMNSSKAEKARQEDLTLKLRRIQSHRTRMQEIEFGEKKLIQDKRHTREAVINGTNFALRTKESLLSDCSRERARLILRKASIDKSLAEGREAWKTINAEKLEFKPGEFNCPACKQELPADKIEGKKKDLEQNFNRDKSGRLEANVARGKSLSTELTGIALQIHTFEAQEQATQIEINDLRKTLSALGEEHTKLNSSEVLETQRAIAGNKEYQELKAKIEALEEEVNRPAEEANDKATLLSKKRDIEALLLEQRNLLATKQLREKGQERIQELTRQESELSASLSQMEGIEFSITQFTRAKMDLLESRINGRFKLVRFKLFDTQINGGEVPCCETLIKGVPYSDANNAAKINAGLDVINTLCEHYQAYAPVFVDNAESVNTLIPVNSQLIRLVVSKDKKLKIDAPQEELFETA